MFPRLCAWRMLSSGMLYRVAWYKLTDVSDMFTAFVIRSIMMEAASLNFGQFRSDYMAQEPRTSFRLASIQNASLLNNSWQWLLNWIVLIINCFPSLHDKLKETQDIQPRFKVTPMEIFFRKQLHTTLSGIVIF